MTEKSSNGRGRGIPRLAKTRDMGHRGGFRVELSLDLLGWLCLRGCGKLEG